MCFIFHTTESFEKYTGAEFEINVSFKKRQKFENLMYDYNAWIYEEDMMGDQQLVSLFDDCLLEMIGLMNHSVLTFKCPKI